MQTFSRGGGRLLSAAHCSAPVLLPSCGGVEVAGFRRQEQEAVRLSGHRPAFGKGGERRFGLGLENSFAVRKTPGKAKVGGRLGEGDRTWDSRPPATICYLCAAHSATGRSGRAMPVQGQTASLRPLPSARTRAGSPGSSQPLGSHSTENFSFPRDGEQERSGHTLTECGDQGQQRGMWTEQSFVAAGGSGLELSSREWVGEVPILNPAFKQDWVGKCLGGAPDYRTQGRSPPPGDGGFLEAPSFARRLAVGSFVFRSPGKAPEKGGRWAGGRRVWRQLVGKGSGAKVPALPAATASSGSSLCCSLVQLWTFLMPRRRMVCSASCGRLLAFVKQANG